MLEYVDDIYFSALSGEEEIFPISDEKYAHGLHLQEVITSSILANGLSKTQQKSHPKRRFHDQCYSRTKKGAKRGESSTSFCGICMDKKTWEEMFQNVNCSHIFCSDCMSKHIAAKIQENIATVRCPDLNCKGVLEPEFCQEIIPANVFQRWGDALCENMVLGFQRFYCPFKDCQAVMVEDGGGTAVVRALECPSCRRLFCGQCKVKWHSGVDCKEFRRCNGGGKTEEMMVIAMAKKEKWMRCSKCKFFVEKSQGCLHMTCRCQNEFCYSCGAKWSSLHRCG